MKLVRVEENDWLNPELVEQVRAVENESPEGFKTVVYMCSGASKHYMSEPGVIASKLSE